MYFSEIIITIAMFMERNVFRNKDINHFQL